MKLWLCALAAALVGAGSTAGGACLTDTTQSDFQAGRANNVDVNVTPGSVVLTKSFAVDQQQTQTSSFGTPFNTTAWVGQSFVPGLSGRLTRVDINLFCAFCSGTSPSIVVGLRATSGGLPTGADLAQATIPSIATDGGEAYYPAIFATPATVTAGVTYALVIRPSTNPAAGKIGLTRAGTSSFGADVYPNGALLNSANAGSTWVVQAFNSTDPSLQTADAAFQTYIHGGYAPNGDLTSDVQDSNPPPGATPSWTSLSWNATIPAQTTLAFQVAASNSPTGPFTFVGPNNAQNQFFTVAGASLSQFNGNRYLKYKAYLTSANSTATPTLADVTMCYSTSSDADLAVTNTDGASTRSAGSQTTYTITVTNNGPSDVVGASVADSFPPALTCTWTCSPGSGVCTPQGWGNIADAVNLLSGQSATYTAICAIASTATGTVSDTVTVTPPAGVNDANGANDIATDTDTVLVSTNVVMTLSSDLPFVQVGDTIHYTLEITNFNGPSDAFVSVLDTLPPQLTAGAWTCIGSGSATCGSGSGNTLTGMATVPAGGKVDYDFAAVVSTEPAGGLLADSASASLQFGTNAPSGSIGANHVDTVVVFRADFEPPPQPPAP